MKELKEDRHLAQTLLVILLMLCVKTVVFGQNNSLKKETDALTKSEKTIDPTRQAAREQLNLLVDELKQIDDLRRSLPIVELVVKKLSPQRPDRCRELLESLFAKFEDQLEQQEKKSGNKNIRYFEEMNLRSLIRIAGKFDAGLAQKFIEISTSNKRYSQLTSKSDASFSLAKDLINDDPNFAVSVANQAIGEQFTTKSLEFIGSLRNKDQALAKAYLLTLMRSLEMRKYPSVNELLLLYSYIFLSKKVPYYETDGRLYSLMNVMYGDQLERQTIDLDLARQYLRLSIKILLQQERYFVTPPLADAKSDLTFINFILPLVIQHTPSLVDALSERKSAIGASLDPAARTSSEGMVEHFQASQKSNNVNEKFNDDVGEQIEKGSYAQERKDQLYYEAAQQAVEAEKFATALDLAGKISVSKLREKAKNFILFDIAQKEISDGKIEDARHRIPEMSDLLIKAYILTLSAIAYIENKNQSKDLQRANEILVEVSGIASDLSPGLEKLSILSGISAAYSRYDTGLALEYLSRSIQIAEKMEDFKGDLGINQVLQLNNFRYIKTPYLNNLTLYEALANLGRRDFNTAISEARRIRNPIAKAKAIVCVCEPIL